MSGKTIYNCKHMTNRQPFTLKIKFLIVFLAKVKHCWVKLKVFNEHDLISRLVFIHISLFYS